VDREVLALLHLLLEFPLLMLAVAAVEITSVVLAVQEAAVAEAVDINQ
jgi:hypothetical protein